MINPCPPQAPKQMEVVDFSVFLLIFLLQSMAGSLRFRIHGIRLDRVRNDRPPHRRIQVRAMLYVR